MLPILRNKGFVRSSSTLLRVVVWLTLWSVSHVASCFLAAACSLDFCLTRAIEIARKPRQLSIARIHSFCRRVLCDQAPGIRESRTFVRSKCLVRGFFHLIEPRNQFLSCAPSEWRRRAAGCLSNVVPDHAEKAPTSNGLRLAKLKMIVHCPSRCQVASVERRRSGTLTPIDKSRIHPLQRRRPRQVRG